MNNNKKYRKIATFLLLPKLVWPHVKSRRSKYLDPNFLVCNILCGCGVK